MAFLPPLPLAATTTPRTAATSAHARNTTRARPRLTTRATIAIPTDPPNQTPDSANTPDSADSVPWMPLPGVVHELLTPEQYDRLAEVAAENRQLLVMDFMASWCRKCLYLLPRLRKIAAANPGMYFCAVDVNKVKRLPKEFEISHMPTFVFVRDGSRVGGFVGGAQPGKVAKMLEDAVRKFAED